MPKAVQLNFGEADISVLSSPVKFFSCGITEKSMDFKSENSVLHSSFIISNLLSMASEIDLASAHDESGGILEFDLRRTSKI